MTTPTSGTGYVEQPTPRQSAELKSEHRVSEPLLGSMRVTPPGKATYLRGGSCGPCIVMPGWYHGYWLTIVHILTTVGFCSFTPARDELIQFIGAVLLLAAVFVVQAQAQCRDPGIVIAWEKKIQVRPDVLSGVELDCHKGTVHITSVGGAEGVELLAGMRLRTVDGVEVASQEEFQRCVDSLRSESTRPRQLVEVEVVTDDCPYHRKGRFAQEHERRFGLMLQRGDWVVESETTGEPIYVWRWCNTCKLRRPPRAAHCTYCDLCVKEYDHYCPIVGSCVAQRTYRYFTLYHLTSLALALWIMVWTCKNAAHWDWKGQTSSWGRFQSASLVLCFISTGIGGLYAFGFGCSYTGMACRDLTLRERTRGLNQGHRCGPIHCVRRLCGPLPVSNLQDAQFPPRYLVPGPDAEAVQPIGIRSMSSERLVVPPV
eukprot:Hpha_TRINITY_DN4837_c0_g1::TRINITY_DN4837_c0_g1_i1::g.20154::m.20154/K16675/ZDHHC9_14_18; palmitoyltransferase ZDHHC9/14/18